MYLSLGEREREREREGGREREKKKKKKKKKTERLHQVIHTAVGDSIFFTKDENMTSADIA